MFMTLTVLTVLITIMFVASVVSSIAALRRESKDFQEMTRRGKAF